MSRSDANTKPPDDFDELSHLLWHRFQRQARRQGTWRITDESLLEQLVRNPGKLVSQRELLLKIWGPKYVDETHYLRQYMAQLRRKLEPDPARPRHLLTELGMGYRYQP